MYGRKHTELTKRKIAAANTKENHPRGMLGKRHSKATKRRMSMHSPRANLGKRASTVTRAKQSLAQIGKHAGILSPCYGTHLNKTRRARISKCMSGTNHWNYGKHLSEATRAKMSASSIGIHVGKLAGMYGKSASKNAGKCKWFKVNGITCQGTYERRFAKACAKYNMQIVRVQKRLHLCDHASAFTYLPDFKMHALRGFIEIKGLLSYKAFRKIKACWKSNIPIHLLTLRGIQKFEQTGDLIFTDCRRLQMRSISKDVYGIDVDALHLKEYHARKFCDDKTYRNSEHASRMLL